MLKKVLKDGAEQPGIDHLYFQIQEEKFKEYQKRMDKLMKLYFVIKADSFF